MIKHVIGIFLLCHVTLFALEADIPTLLQIVKENPSAVEERLILAKYYKEQKNMLKAELLLDEVLAIDAENDLAKKMKAEITEERSVDALLRKEGLYGKKGSDTADKVLKNLYAAKQFIRYEALYRALIQKKAKLQDLSHANAARVYLRTENIKASRQAASRIVGKKKADALRVNAEICYAERDYACTIDNYEKVGKGARTLDDEVALINSYLSVNETEKAEQVYGELSAQQKKYKQVEAVAQKLQKRKEENLASLKKAYEANGDYPALNAYAQTLYNMGRTAEAISVVEKHNRTKGEKESLYFEAQLLVWSNKLNKAVRLLQKAPLDSDPKAQVLLGKVYSWQQNYTKAVPLLKKAKKNTSDAEVIYEADRALAFIDLWQRKLKSAKKGFVALQKTRPEDREVKEALMELNGEYPLLINIYKKRLKQDPKDPKLHLRLGRLLQKNNQQTEAIKHYEFYLKHYPYDKSAKQDLLAIKTQKKNAYQRSPQLEIADKLYFDGHYEAALFYFENHLQKRPEDYDSRFRYAFSLENAKQYGKAEGEFFLMQQKRNTDYITYHYAFNLMKNGKTAEAETLFHDLKQRVLKTLPPSLEDFVEGWRKSWQDKNYKRYLSYYAPKYKRDKRWSTRKKMRFEKEPSRTIEVYDPLYRSIGDNSYELSFYQVFTTRRGSDKGYKTLTLSCDASGYSSCKIVDEQYETGDYYKRELLEPYIDDALKVIGGISPMAAFEKKKR
jgi:tetratricopeptide (TPR) repeat protein